MTAGPGRTRTGAVKLLVIVFSLVSLGGCVVNGSQLSSDGRSSAAPADSIVHDNKLTLDFRHRPSRADFGLADDRNFRAYQRSGPMLHATVILPTGTVNLPCFLVQAATDQAGGTIDSGVDVYSHPPKYFDIERVFDSADQARQSLLSDARTLGLHTSEVEDVVAAVGPGAATQSRTLTGLVDDWLSVEVTVDEVGDGQVQVDYAISVDVYHNPAVDKIVHDGVVRVDLTDRPDRAALGFLDTYSLASVTPAPDRSLRADLVLAQGTITVPLGSMISPAPTATGEPTQTVVTAHPMSVADARRLLESQAAALGIDRAAVEAAFDGPPNTRSQRTLEAASSPVYEVSVKLDAHLGQAGGYAASVTYRFTYR